MLALFLLPVSVMAAARRGNSSALSDQRGSFRVENGKFVLDGQPFQIISGEMHYERIPRAYWKARLQMAKAMGLNTIATYVFWNLHEPEPGKFDFSGNADLAQFIRDAQQTGLKVLLRAGPYSCAEWEFGGFPAWLMKNPKMQTALRSNDPEFMKPAEQWILRLGREVAPLQVGYGGPIIGVQIENEYGDFGGDAAYLEHLKKIFLKAGFTQSLLYTANPSRALVRGSIPGVYSAVNFAPGHAAQALDSLAQLRAGQPLLSSEYWTGWFDHWGEPHQSKPLSLQVKDFNYILRHGAGVNLYMFHGGTSFGMMSGSSWTKHQFLPDVTSYDYGAPLDEAGHPTPAYYAYRKIIAAYLGHALPPVPAAPPVMAIAPFALHEASSLWRGLPKPVVTKNPEPMEWLGQSYGFILYRKTLHHAVDGDLVLNGMNDYALVYLNGKLQGTLNRTCNDSTLMLHSNSAKTRLDILVENSGRINSTRMMLHANKGLMGPVMLAGRALHGWKTYRLPMKPDTIADPLGMPQETHFNEKSTPAQAMSGPAFYRGTFRVETKSKQIPDTFLDIRGLGKGAVWIDGHPIGRYWNVGPQDTLYVPGPWLHRGKNEIMVLDLFQRTNLPRLAGLTQPILNGPARKVCNATELSSAPAEMHGRGKGRAAQPGVSRAKETKH
ncbi:glycosyl hydrolase, family 35 [Acidobacterium capsulatum ATCC 51196]|uniref:Beta-galactosidase n=2 Tax=Acidobacteriaceae TaxID=204434 RepID=C1F148_ACIC5|nr:glycosyl hydrolase, family 35 [Acidobacterium capsulatum ATCC 51196]